MGREGNGRAVKGGAWFCRLNQFGAVRILTGGALLYFFAALGTSSFAIPISQGEVPSGLLQACFAAGGVGAVLFLLGSFTRIAALFCLACLNASLVLLPVVVEIHYPFLSLLLGTYAIFSSQSWGAWRPRGLRDELRDRECWYLPLFFSVFLGFTFLGVNKLLYPLWRNGEAVRLLCPRGPLGTALPFVCDWLPNRLIGWCVFLVEGAALPLVFHPRTRPLAWALNVLLQLGISQFLFLWRITFVMLVMLGFLFDARWLQQLVRPKSIVKASSR